MDPDPKSGPPRVELRVTATGVSVPGAMELEVPDAKTTLEILAIAHENRATGATDCNAHSSRSHLVVTLRLESAGPDGACNNTKLQLVDLAGACFAFRFFCAFFVLFAFGFGCMFVGTEHSGGAALLDGSSWTHPLAPACPCYFNIS